MESRIASFQASVTSCSEFERESQTIFTHNVLPVLDHLSQLYLPFQNFEFIQIFFCILQFFQTSFWISYGQYWAPSKLTNTFHYISFFFSINQRTTEHTILFFVLFPVVLIIFILSMILIFNFNRVRRVNKTILIIVRFYFTFFGCVIIHPLASLTGHLIRRVIDDRKNTDIFLLTFSIIGFSLSEILFYFNQIFANQSIYIHKSLWCTFDSKILIFLFMANPIFLILGNLFQYYPKWTYYFLISFHIILIILILLDYTWMPFIIDFGNTLTLSIIASLIFNDIFRLIVEIFPVIKIELFLTISYLLFFAFLALFHFILKLVRKRINSNLSHSKLSSENYEDKFEYFRELKIHHTIQKLRTYLVISFTTLSDMFLDFSLVQFSLESYKDSPEVIALLIHLLCYFKSEKNRFESAMKMYRELRDTSLFDHFIYYQAHRLALFRQSTATNTSSTRLNDLKVNSINLEGQIKNFWSSSVSYLNVLDILDKQRRKLSSLWDESVEENWSSVIFREEQIRFLIECCTDYSLAVQMMNIKEKLEAMRDDREDLCFLSLIHCFPDFLNNKIIDKEGNFIVKKIEKETINSSSTSNEKYSTTSNEYDFTFDEQIANAIMTFGRLRLSMQNALKQVQPNHGKILTFYTIFSMFSSFILLIVTFSVFLNLFDSFDDWNKEVGVLTELRISYSKAFLSLSIVFGQSSNRFFLNYLDCNNSYDPNHLFLDRSIKFDDLALFYVDEAREQFSLLMEAILSLSIRRVDISTLTSLFFDPSINSTICYFGLIFDHYMWSMEQVLNFQIMSYSILAEDKDEINYWYYNNTYWCHDIATVPIVEDMFNVIQNALSDDLSNTSKNTVKNTEISMYVVGPSFFVLFLLPLPLILVLYRKEINHLIKMMLATDQEFKEQARKNISLAVANENSEVIPPVMKKSLSLVLIIYFILLLVVFFVFIVIVELIFYYSKETSFKLRDFGFFLGHFSLLRAYLVEMLNQLINAIYYVEYPQKHITNETFRKRIYKILEDFENTLYEILNETPMSPSAVGLDRFIDDIVFKSFCESSEFLVDLHDSYQCGSLNRLTSTIHSLFEKAAEEIQMNNGIFKGDFLSNIYHIIFAHTITMIQHSKERFNSLQKEEIMRYKTVLFVLFICGVISVAIWSFLLFIINYKFKRIFDMALCLIRRLSPVGFISNSELTNYLLFKKGEEIEMGVTHTIFNNSFDGILCLNPDGIVEIINKSFATDYGYSTEQLVGQMISTIFDNESRIKFENQLKLIKNHESSAFYTEHVICFTNDGRAVPSFINLIGLKGKENNMILVVHDETILLQKKKKLELAKKQSQDLLEQIMPPKVLMMLKEGKSDISFQVPSATVMFVNIVNFSGFSADLSPQQIMGTLSTLFGAFDTWIQKFPLMTKIKLIGDSYMAACGLFTVDDDEPKNHAKQSIDFALRVFDILDDANIKLNVDLKIRIGLNSDGPIIAGVLGTENRVFDIIGDTINVASRLEHKAEPGHIMMSEKTFELVKEFGYNIVAKGEVFLKGKGNMKAYSI